MDFWSGFEKSASKWDRYFKDALLAEGAASDKTRAVFSGKSEGRRVKEITEKMPDLVRSFRRGRGPLTLREALDIRYPSLERRLQNLHLSKKRHSIAVALRNKGKLP